MKVNKIIVSFLIIVAVLITPHTVLAQPDPNDCTLDPNGCPLPDPGIDPDSTQVPFDAGLTILLGAGIASALKRSKVKGQRSKRNTK